MTDRELEGAVGELPVAVFRQRLRALGDPMRVIIVSYLQSNNGGLARDLEVLTGLAKPTISHHVRLLRKAGLVDGPEPEAKGGGTRPDVWLTLNMDAFAELVAALESFELSTLTWSTKAIE